MTLIRVISGPENGQPKSGRTALEDSGIDQPALDGRAVSSTRRKGAFCTTEVRDCVWKIRGLANLPF